MLSRGDCRAGRWVILSLAITLLVAAFALWKVYRLDRVAAVVLGLGLPMAIPTFGSWLVGHSGLSVSGFDTPSYFSFKMLITALGTLALGLVAYATCRKSIRRIAVCCLWGVHAHAALHGRHLGRAASDSSLAVPLPTHGDSYFDFSGLFVAALDQSKCVLLLLVMAAVVVASGAFTWGGHDGLPVK